MTVLCIHHRDLDGWGAGAVVPGVDEYFGVGYNYDNHTELLNMCGGKDVVLVDFSFPTQVMKNIKEVSSSFIWIDHHDSAKKCVELGLDGIFDMTDAGCRLTWKFFHPEEKMPRAINHAGDRDIWEFKDPNTRAFCFALSALPGIEDPGSVTWKALVDDTDEVYDPILEAGRFIERTIDNDNLWRKRLGLFRKEKIFLINATSQISELASDILNDYGKDKIVIVWRANKNRVDLSFRGTGAQQMAETFGGGGHLEAAGASMRVKEGMAFVTDLMKDMYPV